MYLAWKIKTYATTTHKDGLAAIYSILFLGLVIL